MLIRIAEALWKFRIKKKIIGTICCTGVKEKIFKSIARNDFQWANFNNKPTSGCEHFRCLSECCWVRWKIHKRSFFFSFFFIISLFLALCVIEKVHQTLFFPYLFISLHREEFFSLSFCSMHQSMWKLMKKTLEFLFYCISCCYAFSSTFTLVFFFSSWSNKKKK